MKRTISRISRISTIFIFIFLLSCSQKNAKKDSLIESQQKIDTEIKDKTSVEKEQITKLIRDVLNWSVSKNSIDLLPIITDDKDSLIIGFDMEILKSNLNELERCKYFTSDFIRNYETIINTLDKKLKNNEFDDWYLGEIPPFTFASDYSPWCNCQDYDNFNLVEVRIIRLDEQSGELDWTWGNNKSDKILDWKNFAYRFNVKKENSKWKISYMQEFDINKTTE